MWGKPRADWTNSITTHLPLRDASASFLFCLIRSIRSLRPSNFPARACTAARTSSMIILISRTTTVTTTFELIREEMDNLLEKGAISEIYNPQDGYFSNLFLVPKKDGGQRPVINLKGLNHFVQYEHFKMEGIQTVKDLLQPGDWLTKVDLISRSRWITQDRKYLRFTVKGRSFKFNCLPFGLSSAPWENRGFSVGEHPMGVQINERGIPWLTSTSEVYWDMECPNSVDLLGISRWKQ